MQTLSADDRGDLARALTELLDDWGVPAPDQIKLLGLPADTRPRAMRRYRQGAPLPDEPAINERVQHLLGIADALQTSHPRNAAGGGLWLNRRNYRFDDRTPLATMLEDGILGIVAVRVHLDCAYDWHTHGH